MNPPNEQQNHLVTAKRLAGSTRIYAGEEGARVQARLAQVHASLAIAEQLERLNETLKEAPHLLDQIAVGVSR